MSASDLPSYALCSPEQTERYAKYTEQGNWKLLSYEIFWQERFDFLNSRGYLLRPRYKPGWSPSWIGTNRHPHFCEDSIRSMKYRVIDSTRLSDGIRVMIKSVSRTDDEIPIARFLSTDNLLQDPTNHCVPILDIFDDPIDPSLAMLVMKYLRPFDNPELRTIGDVTDFIFQTLEGLCFIHNQGVAHRDCASANIMMDAQLLFPQGHHPVRLGYLEDGLHEAPCLSRQERPVKYYFIDFGLSSRFEENQTPLVLGTKGRDKEPPELDDETPYNPFLLDIFILGNVYLKEFAEKYYGLEFLGPLIDDMLQTEPEDRPTAEIAFRTFQKIQSSLTEPTLRWRLRSRKETAPERVVYDTVAAAREGIYRIKRMIV